MADKIVYLDYAAATPMDSQVEAAMQPYLSQDFYNPSATYAAARQVHQDLDKARSVIAHWLGSRSSEIIFTAGATEANNLAIHGIMRRFPDANIVVSAIEHESVLVPAARYDYREVKVHKDGRIDIDDLRQKIDDKTVLVSIMYANNEIGTIEPIREISKIVQEKRRGRERPIYLHSDAAQAPNYLDLHVARLGVDMLSLNGGKIYGPKQSGALYVKAGVELDSLIQGGGQERGLRSGTENVAAGIGMATALDQAQESRHQEAGRVQQLRDQFLALIEQKLPTVIVNGSMKYRLPNNLHITLPGHDNERLLIQLDEAGIMAAAGSACSASNDEPSHVLRAIGLDDNAARASLRFSLGRDTTLMMIEACANVLEKLV